MIMAMGPDRSTMTATARRVAVALAAALLGLSATARCHAADPVAIERLTRAWRAIEARYQKFDCRWSADVTYMARTLSGPRGELFPPADVTHSMKYRLACDGSKVRFTKEGFEYDPVERRDFMMKSFINTFDGKMQLRAYLNSNWTVGGTGFVSEIDHCDYAGHSIRPVVLAFRPLATAMGAPDPASFAPQTERETVDGVDCNRYDAPMSASKPENRHSYYVARSSDARIIRHESVVQARPRYQLNLRYRDDGSPVPQLVGFSCATWGRNGQLESAASSTQLTVDIAPTLPASEFTYIFPRGFGVLHNQTGQTALSRGDGTFRFVTEGEQIAGISREELLRTAAPPEAYFYRQDAAVISSAQRMSRWGILTLILFSAAWICLRWRRGRAKALRRAPR